MILIYRKKERKAVIYFRELEKVNSDLLSVDTAISLIDKKTPWEEVLYLQAETDRLRKQREIILNKIQSIA